MLDRHVPLGLVALLGCTPRPTANLQDPTTVTPAVRPPEVSSAAKLAEDSKARWIDLSIETEFGCAVERTGSVFCWGRGPSAEMNLREIPDQPSPESTPYGTRKWGPASRVEMIHDARKVSTTGGLACAIVEDGRVRCWGAVRWGTPHVFDVPGIAGAIDLEIGDGESCVTLETGALQCWSADDFGVPGRRLDGALAVAVGDNLACGLTTQGYILCWGQGIEDWHRYNPATAGSPAPGPDEGEFSDTLEVGRFPGAVDLALSGWNNLCVLRGDGKVACSERDVFTLLRNEDLEMHEVEGSSGIASFDSSRHHACGRTVEQGALCWGRNTFGQLGDGGSSTREGAAPVVGLGGVTKLSVADDWSCALTRADDITCWGFDRGEALGHEDIHVHTIEGLQASSIAAGERTSCAVDANKKIRCWGSEQQLEQIGIVGLTTPTVVDLQGSGELVDIDPGWETCFLLSSGTLQCGTWASGGSTSTYTPSKATPDVVALAGAQPPACTIIGSGRKAQLHCGATLTQLEPDRQLKSPFDVSAFNMRGCVAHSGGKVSCFAEYYYWGNGARPDREFEPIAGISDAMAVTSASAHDCALGKDGRVHCWTGRVETEWSEDNRTVTRMRYRSAKPEDLGLEQIIQIVSGSQHHCALSKLGKVSCWEDNPFSETTIWQPTPELGPDIVELAAGTEHTCARDRAGKVTCWGDDVWGQLGRVPSRVYLAPTTMKID